MFVEVSIKQKFKSSFEIVNLPLLEYITSSSKYFSCNIRFWALSVEVKLEKSNAFSSASSIVILLVYSITIYSYRLFVLAKVGAAIFTLLALLGLFNCAVLVVVAVTASSKFGLGPLSSLNVTRNVKTAPFF